MREPRWCLILLVACSLSYLWPHANTRAAIVEGMGQAACSSKDSCRCPEGENSIEIDRTIQATRDSGIGCAAISENGFEVKAPIVTGKDNPADNSFWKQKNFDYDRTTEDSFAIPHFTGPNRDIRPLLDYTYHKKYNEERTMLQDRLIAELSGGGHKQEDLLLPWVIFTAGAMGAGKGFVMEWMEKQGCLPLDKFVIVDPDMIRQALPEWDGYVAKDPLTAAIKTQKEAGHIAEILGYKALRMRWNVIFDGSLRDVEWYKVYFQKLRHAFPGIRLMILHIQAEREAVLRRAEERGKATGRMVPRELLESSMEAVPISVNTLAPYVDVAIKCLNLSNQEPQLEREPSGINPPLGITVTPGYIKKL